MIVSYCKKCKIESEGAVCQQCGKRAPSSNVRDVWRTVRVPGADAGAWRSAIGILSFTVILLLAVLLLAERFGSSAQNFSASVGTLISAVAVAGVIGLLIVLAAFALQGREEIRYILDMEGAHMQTWYRASRIHAWARLQRANMSAAIQSRDGSRYIKAEERHLLWQDINEIGYSPSTGTIRLYRAPHLAPFVLRIPPEEYEMAEALIKKHTKVQK